MAFVQVTTVVRSWCGSAIGLRLALSRSRHRGSTWVGRRAVWRMCPRQRASFAHLQGWGSLVARPVRAPGVITMRGNLMRLTRRRFSRLAAGAVALPALLRTASAQAYPNRPVRIVVGFAAGGPNDIAARIIAQ